MQHQHSSWAVIILLFAWVSGAWAAKPSIEGFAERHFDNESVSIAVKVHSGVYTYKVTNRSNSPITDFKVATPAAFAIIVPDGWGKEITKEYLRAGSDSARSAILPERTESFRLYAIGKGSVLGTAPVQLGFESGQVCTIDGVWAPVLEPRYYTRLVIASLLCILIAHAALLIYKDRCRTASDH